MMKGLETLTSREARLFNMIAPFYGLFFNFQVKYYKKILDQVQSIFDISDYEKIIDVGCGTGALCYILHQRGHRVTGIDVATKMLAIARKKLIHTGVELMEANVLETTQFPSKSFDIAIASYVAHGAKQPRRLQMYAEMSRLAKHYVIIHDYNDKRAFSTDIIEWMEGGDYFHFIANAQQEMKDIFSSLQIINIDTRAAWYIAAP